VETATGFRHAAERMLDGDVLLGGSESGSFGFKNHLPDRDGVSASLLLLEAMASAGKPLDALVADVYAMVGPHHDARADLRVPQEQARRVAARLQSFKDGAFADAAVAGVVRKDGTRIDLADGTWLLVRASGAEPVVRLYAEATTADRARQLVEAGSALVNNA
jgi:phosphomannomutase